MRKPFVVVVTGRPGSGKTTLAHQLASQIHCPALCRDEFKEGYVHTQGGSHKSLGRGVNLHLYEIFFDIVRVVLAKDISVVVEAAFQHKLWTPQLTPLTKIANVCIVVCTVDPHLAHSRFIERGLADATRTRFHGDRLIDAAADEVPLGDYQPPEMELPTLTVDTTDGYTPGLEQIVAFVLQFTAVTKDENAR